MFPRVTVGVLRKIIPFRVLSATTMYLSHTNADESLRSTVLAANATPPPPPHQQQQDFLSSVQHNRQMKSQTESSSQPGTPNTAVLL
jgi:hypothetical protein